MSMHIIITSLSYTIPGLPLKSQCPQEYAIANVSPSKDSSSHELDTSLGSQTALSDTNLESFREQMLQMRFSPVDIPS